jgi:hypothetical protein
VAHSAKRKPCDQGQLEDMKVRHLLGLALLVAGAILQPVGWMHSRWFTVVSFVCFVAGVVLVMYGSPVREGAGGKGFSEKPTGREIPGDIHGHSGQFSGGRSRSWESHDSSEGGAGD